MENKINSADYLLLLLYLNNQEPIKGSTRLMKMMFIFNKEILSKISKPNEKIIINDFEAYKFGPFSKSLYEQVALFTSLEFIKVDTDKKLEELANLDNFEEDNFEADNFQLNESNLMYIYKIKKNGIEYVENEIIPHLNNEAVVTKLEKFKNKINEISIKNLLFYVYNKYPDYTKKSIIKDEVLKGHEKKTNL